MRQRFSLFSSHYSKNSLLDGANIVAENMYFEELPDKSNPYKSPLAAITFPGYSAWCTVSANSGVVRALFTHKDVAYAIVSNTLYSINSAGTQTSRGTLNTSSGRVTLASVTDQIIIADGTNCYSYVPSTTTFTTLTDPDLPASVKYVTAVNGYFLYVQPNSTTVWVSALNAGQTIGSLSFFSANAISDSIQNIIGFQYLVYVFGQKQTTIWYNSGGQDVPFDPYSTSNLEIGLAAPYTAITILDQVYWLGKDKSGIVGLVQAKGLEYNIIDNKAFVEDINNASTTALAGAFATTEVHDGHIFYIITVPRDGTTAGFTYAYDITTGMWSTRSSYNISATPYQTYDRYRSNCQTTAYGLQLIGDYQLGVIYSMSQSVNLEAGEQMRRTLISPTICYNNNFLSGYNLEVEVEQGVADSTTTDPQLVMYISKTRGRTWSNEISRSIGMAGEYNKRVRVFSLGGGRDLTIKLVMTDPVPWKILGGTVELQVQDN